MTLVTTLHLDKYEVGKGITADRFFVRAFAATASSELQSANRYAFTIPSGCYVPNPPWRRKTQPRRGTPPSSDPAATPLTIRAFRAADGGVVLMFDGTLQQTRRLGEPFQDVPGATSLFPVPVQGSTGFFRARK